MDTATCLWNASTLRRQFDSNIIIDNVRYTTVTDIGENDLISTGDFFDATIPITYGHTFTVSGDGTLTFERKNAEMPEPAEEEPMDTTEVDKFLSELAEN